MNNFHYFGLFLDTETKNRLMDMLTDNIDHCTLLHVSQLHGNSEIYNYLNNRLEEKIQIVINGIGISDRAMAFRVDKHSVVCVNDIPHITIATFNGGLIIISFFMAKLVKNDKGFKVIKLSVDEAGKLGWGISGSGDCVCMHCNNPILGDIYYPVVLNDTMDKECYEEWCKDAINYPEDREYEERAFQRIAKLLNIQTS